MAQLNTSENELKGTGNALCDQREGTPRSACTGGAPHAMHIVLGVDGHVIVDDHIDCWDVQASAGDICKHSNTLILCTIMHSSQVITENPLPQPLHGYARHVMSRAHGSTKEDGPKLDNSSAFAHPT